MVGSWHMWISARQSCIIREPCDKHIREHAAMPEADSSEAIRQYGVRAEWASKSLARTKREKSATGTETDGDVITGAAETKQYTPVKRIGYITTGEIT
jgi:hypothetical protein